jgi:hypothetical protein
VTLRHLGSGLVCHFADNGDGGRIIVFPQLARGEDVGCDFNSGEGAAITLYATRYPFASTLDEQLAGAEAAILQRFAGARVTGVAVTDANVPQRASAFLFTHNNTPRFSSVHIAQIGDWTIKQRYTARATTDAEIAAAAADATARFAAVLAEIAAPPNL